MGLAGEMVHPVDFYYFSSKYQGSWGALPFPIECRLLILKAGTVQELHCKSATIIARQMG